MAATSREITTDDRGIRCVAIPTKAGYHERATGDEPCNICGRETDGRYYVLVGHGGGVALHPEDVDEYGENALGGGYLGALSVGPTCRKELPAEFVGDRKELYEELGIEHEW